MSAHNFGRLMVEPFEGRVVPSSVPTPPTLPWSAADVSLMSPQEDAATQPAADQIRVTETQPVELLGEVVDVRFDRMAGSDLRGSLDQESVDKVRSTVADPELFAGSFAAEIRERALPGANFRNSSPFFPLASTIENAFLRYSLPPAGTRTVWRPSDGPTLVSPTQDTGVSPANGNTTVDSVDPRTKVEEAASQSVGPAAVLTPLLNTNTNTAPPRDDGESSEADLPPETIIPLAESLPPGAIETVVQTVLTWAVPLAGEWPLDPDAFCGAVDVIRQLADLKAELPIDGYLDDSAVWLGGVMVTAGAAGYGVFLHPPRPRLAAGRLGFDSVLARWNDHDPNR